MTFAHSAEVVSLERKVKYWRVLAKQWEVEVEELEAKLKAIERQAEDKHEYVLAQINERLKAENAALRKRLLQVSNRIGCGCGGDYGLCKSCEAVLEAAEAQEQKI